MSRWLEEEELWLDRARRGDAEAFARIYEAFADPIFSEVLLPKLGDRVAAEEALAETFRTALEQLPRFELRGVSAYFWLARIAANKAMDLYRERTRTGRALASFEALLGPLRPPPDDPARDAERKDELGRLRIAVARVLDWINPRYRRALELRILEERPRSECAEALAVTLATFDVVLLRALRAFRKEWGVQ